MFGLGGGEIVVIVLAALLVFGPGKIPEIARAIKRGYQEFSKVRQQVDSTVSELRSELDLNLDDDAAPNRSKRLPAPQLRAPDGERVGLRPPEPGPVREPAGTISVPEADDYLAPREAEPDSAGGADDYLAGGEA